MACKAAEAASTMLLAYELNIALLSFHLAEPTELCSSILDEPTEVHTCCSAVNM